MLYYIMINFHTSASNGEQIQKGNNGKNHEAVVIKSVCPQKYPEEQWKSYVLYW